jgi:hypothetical protein
MAKKEDPTTPSPSRKRANAELEPKSPKKIKLDSINLDSFLSTVDLYKLWYNVKELEFETEAPDALAIVNAIRTALKNPRVVDSPPPLRSAYVPFGSCLDSRRLIRAGPPVHPDSTARSRLPC